MEVIWKNTTPRECSERVKESPKGIQDTHSVCCAAYTYEPCKSDYFGGLGMGKLCINLHAKFLTLKPDFSMSVTVLYHF